MEQVLFRLIVDTDESEQRKEAVSTIEAVEQRELLPAVYGVDGRIEIQGDDFRLLVATRLITNLSRFRTISTISRDEGEFSNREIVDCVARLGSNLGSRPIANFIIGSLANELASIPSS